MQARGEHDRSYSPNVHQCYWVSQRMQSSQILSMQHLKSGFELIPATTPDTSSSITRRVAVDSNHENLHSYTWVMHAVITLAAEAFRD